jgi:2-methylfumaryl-CoA isomerase
MYPIRMTKGGAVTGPDPLPLAGLRIVELSSFVATPLCGLALAQLGAEVIRVEPLGGAPDRGRWPLSEQGTSLYWTGLNRGKRAIELDLSHPEGVRLVADLVVDGDGIVVSNSERHTELGYEALSERRADLIHLTLVGRRGGGGRRGAPRGGAAGGGGGAGGGRAAGPRGPPPAPPPPHPPRAVLGR